MNNIKQKYFYYYYYYFIHRTDFLKIFILFQTENYVTKPKAILLITYLLYDIVNKH